MNTGEHNVPTGSQSGYQWPPPPPQPSMLQALGTSSTVTVGLVITLLGACITGATMVSRLQSDGERGKDDIAQIRIELNDLRGELKREAERHNNQDLRLQRVEDAVPRIETSLARIEGKLDRERYGAPVPPPTRRRGP